MSVYHILRFDGSARPNPGAGGAGVVIYRASVGDQFMDEIYRGSFWLGGHGCTNNACEWRALTRGLQEAARLGIREVDVEGDAELVVKQWNGVYAVRNTQLRQLLTEARDAASYVRVRSMRHIPRKQNSMADQLANEAVDTKSSRQW